jgi:ABC-type sugar transport system ATPase subunit
LTVYKNISFSLYVQKIDKKSIDQSVQETAEILGITHLLDRQIKGLSGGERQRVALGRAIVRKPSLLLLDEPVCALDESTRESICQELKKLQRNLNIPIIHVCHSFEEASYLADKIGIIQNGKMIQAGTLKDVQRKPLSPYIARMIRLENVFSATAIGREIKLNDQISIIHTGTHFGSVQCVIRPWQIKISSETTHCTAENQVSGTLTEIIYTATAVKLRLEGCIDLVFYALYNDVLSMSKGMTITVNFPRDAIHVFDDN